MNDRTKRTVPFLLAIAGYLIGVAGLRTLASPTAVTALRLCYAGNGAVFLGLSRPWKISVHASGVIGPATALGSALGIPGALFGALVVPVARARTRLGAHSWGRSRSARFSRPP